MATQRKGRYNLFISQNGIEPAHRTGEFNKWLKKPRNPEARDIAKQPFEEEEE
jgi:hypothetical protein